MSGRNPVGVVLAGGASTRMGVDKATLIVDQKPMAVRVADAMWEAGCRPVECQGGDLDAMSEYGLVTVPDSEPGGGPAAAIRDVLDRHEGLEVIVAACDLVDIDAATISAVLAVGSAADDDVDVAVVAAEGRRHLVSWWRAGLATRLTELLDSGVRSYNGALSTLRTVEVPVDPRVVHNVNTPADLEGLG